MKKLLFIIPAFFLLSEVSSQSTVDYCIRLTASIQENPAQITIQWPFDTTGITNYYVSRKAKEDAYWTITLATLPQTATAFTDTTVVADSAYEYRVSKSGTIAADGYIYAGIKAPVIEYRGKLLLIVDSLLNDSLSTETFRLMKDISGDGWAVQRVDVDPADKDFTIKSIISSVYHADSTDLKAVLLMGHVAVPYSGDINPDGHPDHQGAWPADVYYANMHLAFTDTIVNDTVAGQARNRNIPGDGKWDQSWMYGSTVELEISRIDLSQMNSFAPTEKQLMISYLNKDHAYRMKNIVTTPRGLVDDNFGVFGGEAFAINSWRNFAPLLGDTNIFSLDYITTLDTADYQWSYGCGGGSPTSSGGIGSTTDFTTHNIKSIFSMLFGSWFGDWDQVDDFMRAPLCAPEPALTVCWAGRPHWEFHHMALGENIGYSARLSQNESGNLYQNNYGGDFVHVALIGDLTLRQHIIAPPQITSLSDTNETATVTWSPSSDSVLGYYVYSCSTEFGKYIRVSPNLITGSTFTDANAGPGLKYYMVRAMRLENTPSGSYYNLSEGISDSITVRDTVLLSQVTNMQLNSINFTLWPNPAREEITLHLDLTGASEFTLEIFSIAGAKIISRHLGPTTTSTLIDVSEMASGLYFCQLVCNKGVMVKRFEVAR